MILWDCTSMLLPMVWTYVHRLMHPRLLESTSSQAISAGSFEGPHTKITCAFSLEKAPLFEEYFHAAQAAGLHY